MKAGDLFSGIGGFSLGLEWAGFETAWFVEKDEFCQKVLNKHWPDVPKYGDIYDFIEKIKRGEIEPVDIITGGFPCQPFSQAGKREGKEDDRYLWPAMLEVISLLRPTWVIGENVAGILNMGFEDMLLELEGKGYRTESFIIPACAVNAPHRRDRVWIIAHTGREHGKRPTLRGKSEGQVSGQEDAPVSERPDCHDGKGDAPDTGDKGLQGGKRASAHGEGQTTHGPVAECSSAWDDPWIEAATRLCRISHGVPNRVDRLKSLGNAVVPHIPYIIGKMIMEIENA